MCFTYNLAFSHDLLDINTTSSDFHYLHTHKIFYQNKHVHALLPQHFPLKISTSQKGLWVGFGSVNSEHYWKTIENDFYGYVVLLHDPFELPSKNSKIFNYNLNLQSKVLINSKLNSIDESLLEYEAAE